MKVTATAKASRSMVSPLYYDRVRKVVHTVAHAIVAAGGARYINRDGRLRFLRAN